MAEGDPTLRIAMWSGPRNLSTALMRSFGNRPDCAVVDEPFYAAFLALSGADHPMRAEILAHHETDWRTVAAELAGPAPGGKAVFYQKHMTHHMLPAIGRDFMRACRNVFLIRRPARVLASYARKREAVGFEDLGFAEQDLLFTEAAGIEGAAPPVIDADALLARPEPVLRGLCERLGIGFTPAMLAWPKGRRATDGIWASHWYDAVERSEGFGAPSPEPTLDDDGLRRIAERAEPLYRRLAAHAITGA
jgi:hypothetical protein